MEHIRDIITEMFNEKELIYGVISKKKKSSESEYKKVTIKPVLVRKEIKIQFTYQFEKKQIHENLDTDPAIIRTMELFKSDFRQGMIFSSEGDYQILIDKNDRVKIIEKDPSRKPAGADHNKQKNYIIRDGEFNEFFYALGIMDERGKVVKSRYDKFRQINRYLEIIADCVPHLKKDKQLNIIDFGCGKAYLTFALYHYLVEILELDVRIIGLDLKEDVIAYCNELSKKLDFKNLEFIQGDIKGYEGFESVDMVVSLHACDTATDESLGKAVKWGADVILAVPCCQHEFFGKIHNDSMASMERHGLIKERMSALVTDTLRTNVLDVMGYQTQVLEFIDMAHTPKNIMIRAFKSDSPRKGSVKQYLEFRDFWNLKPYIEEVMGESFTEKLKSKES